MAVLNMIMGQCRLNLNRAFGIAQLVGSDKKYSYIY